MPEGFQVVPRNAEGMDDPDWTWGLRLVAWGRPGDLTCVDPVAPLAQDNRVTYDCGAITEWYLNDQRGLKQDCTIDGAEPSAEPLRLLFEVSGSLVAKLVDDGGEVEFLTAQGTAAIRFASLSVLDATGRRLPAAFESDGDEGAVFVHLGASAALPGDLSGGGIVKACRWPTTRSPIPASRPASRRSRSASHPPD